MPQKKIETIPDTSTIAQRVSNRRRREFDTGRPPATIESPDTSTIAQRGSKRHKGKVDTGQGDKPSQPGIQQNTPQSKALSKAQIPIEKGKGKSKAADETIRENEKNIEKSKHLDDEDDFKVLKERSQLLTDYINDCREDFHKLGYDIKQLNKLQFEINSLEEAISREPDNTEHRALFIDNYNAIKIMVEDLHHFLSIDHHLEAERDKERKERIEKLLEKLPRKKEDRPILSDLPREQWWKLYIRTEYHKEAQQMSDPGLFLDQHRGPKYKGYKQSMLSLFDTVLVPARNSGQEDMNYDDYTRMHDLVTEFLPNDERDQMRGIGGINELTKEYNRYCYTIGENKELIIDRIGTFQEMEKDRINGRPLLQMWQSEKEYVEQIVDDITKSPSKAITVGWVRHDYKPTAVDSRDRFYGAEPGYILMIPSYLKSECPGYINSVLKSYYQGRKKPDQTEYDRLTEIARTIRTLFIMHPKFDGNGRTITALLNKFLQEEGFSPTILPTMMLCQTLDKQVEDTLIGMHSFIREVEKSKENTRETSHLA